MKPLVPAILAAVLAVAVLAVPAVHAEASEDGVGDDEPTATVSLYGYVSDVAASGGNAPLASVEVSLLDADGNLLSFGYTDDNGYFSLNYTGTDTTLRLHFTYSGYTVRTLPDSSMELLDSNLVRIDLTAITPDSEGNYPLSSSSTGQNPFGMAVTSQVIYGYVQGSSGTDPFYIEGATVVAVSDSGMSYSTTTDANGYFQLTVEHGSYTMTVSCNGFKTSEAVTSETGTAMYFVLAENESGFIGGIDTPHALMLLGLVMIGVMLTGTFILMRKSREPDSEITVVDDIDSFERSEGDRIERP